MAKKLTEIIDVTNPSFLKEYEGHYISAPEGIYQVKNGQFSLWKSAEEMNNIGKLWTTTWNNKYRAAANEISDIGRRAMFFDPKGGLQPAGKGSYMTSEAFRYFGQGTIPYEQIASNFGMGATINYNS